MKKVLLALVPASLLVVAMTASLGCATSFRGSAHFPNGVRGCRVRSARDGGEMANFVYVGEYSSACVCGPRGGQSATASAGAATAAAVGVMTQMRNSEQQQQAAMAATR